MDDILSYDKSKEPDFYEILGCDPSSSEEQILAEYRNRAVILHPDKNPGDEESVHRFQLLQEAKATLTEPGSRAQYDRWRSSGVAVPYARWRSMAQRGQTLHWAKAAAPQRMLGDSRQPAPAEQQQQPEETAHPRGPLVWQRDTSDFLRKFRNYEI